MRKKELVKYKYVVFTQKDGKMIKRYYYNVKDANGRLCKKFFYAKRVGFFEKIKLKKEIATKKFSNLPKNKQVCLKMIAATSALLVASSIALGFMLANENKEKKPQNFDRNESGYVQREEAEEKKEIELKVPVPKTYEQNGNTFLSLDSALEISHYNYEQLKKELAQYNKTASEKNKYNFNPSMFDSSIFVGVQVRESSLILNDADDKSYKGGFKIGADALKEANEVSIALTGQPVALSEEDLNDPIKSSKACMYCYVKNYEYLHDEINNKDLNVKVTDEMVIDEYLFGCGNLFKELNGNGYVQKTYSKIILDYAEILRPYNETILKGNASEEELAQQRRATYNKLYKVPEKYAEKEK
ncbi:MAG: hypothetical protein J6J24_03160 [Clostridia bacterium]|nr:hypothetical protein [Clostridia bacterium]